MRNRFTYAPSLASASRLLAIDPGLPWSTIHLATPSLKVSSQATVRANPSNHRTSAPRETRARAGPLDGRTLALLILSWRRRRNMNLTMKLILEAILYGGSIGALTGFLSYWVL